MIVPIQNAKHLNGFVLEMQKEKQNTKEPPLLNFMHIHGVFGQMGSNGLRWVSLVWVQVRAGLQCQVLIFIIIEIIVLF